VKRILCPVFALVILCLSGQFKYASAQTDQLSSFQRTDTNANDLILRGASNDGLRFVFESTADLVMIRNPDGTFRRGNEDGNQEIFMYDVLSQQLIQITETKDEPDPADSTKVFFKVSNNSPVISGDGRYIAFSSNSPSLAGPNPDGNQEIFLAFIERGATTATFQRITNTSNDSKSSKEIFENYTPTISNDGKVIAFVSTRNIAASNSSATINNTDGNSEIYLYRVGAVDPVFQVTSKLDSEATVDGVTVKGFNAAPFLSGDGKVLAFLSGFDYALASATVNNKDFNGEIFVYKIGDAANTVTQVTNTTSSDALANNPVVNLLTLSARHLNNNGSLLVFESSGNFDASKNADKTREVFLYNTVTKAFTQITDQKPAHDPPTTEDFDKLDANFLPGINDAGTFITFGSVLDLAPVTTDPKTDNKAGNREVFRVDITNPASLKFRQMTFTQPSGRFLDQRQNTPVSWINDAGNLITFHTSSDVVGTNSDRTFEIFQTLIRPITSVNADPATIVNAASFEPASPATALTMIARGATGSIFGTYLSNNTDFATSANLPFDLSGVSVTVAGVGARLIFVSPGQINFQFPPGVAAADSVDFTVNNNGVLSKGKVKVVDIAPAIYTVTSAGTGRAAAQCLAVLTAPDGMVTAPITQPPCEVSTGDTPDRYLIIYGTGWRNGATGAVTVQVQKDTDTPVTLATNYVGAQPTFALAGLDQINAILPKDLAKGTLKLTVLGPGTIKSQDNVTIEIK